MLWDEYRLQGIFWNATWGEFSWRLQAITLSIQNMLMTFFDHEGVVPLRQMVDHHYCWGISQHLRDKKTSETIVKPRVVDWPWHCTSAHRFFSTANFGCRKFGYRPPPFLLASFGPSWFCLVSKNVTASMRVLLPGCPWISAKITDHPICNSRMSVQRCWQQWQIKTLHT